MNQKILVGSLIAVIFTSLVVAYFCCPYTIHYIPTNDWMQLDVSELCQQGQYVFIFDDEKWMETVDTHKLSALKYRPSSTVTFYCTNKSYLDFDEKDNCPRFDFTVPHGLFPFWFSMAETQLHAVSWFEARERNISYPENITVRGT